MPSSFDKYIEPFIGGGALFFRLNASKAVIADSNPELINMYQMIAQNSEQVITALKEYRNEEEFFYQVRSKDWTKCDSIETAARTIYLNHTCFNGLYRLNRKGQFNTPFGKYKNPTICNEEKIRSAAEVLKNTEIICGDYLDVLKRYAQKK